MPVKPALTRRKKPKLVVMDTVESKTVHWLWAPYIPFGMVTTLDGDPGVGKSWITAAITAALTTGQPLPGQTHTSTPQKVLLMSAEDDPSYTIRPRLESMGADLSRVAVPDEFFVLDPQGIRDMEEYMREFAATIVFIDPIVAYMGGKIDMNKANEVRGLMQPLGDAARRTGSAIIVVRHLRKAESEKDIYRGAGSIDGIAAVRSGLMAMETPGGQTVMKHIKSNLAMKGPPLEYHLDGDGFRWIGRYDAPPAKEPAAARRAAQKLIFDLLKDGEVILASEAIAAAEAAGISQRTLTRAKQGIVVVENNNGQWYWSLDPDAAELLGT